VVLGRSKAEGLLRGNAAIIASSLEKSNYFFISLQYIKSLLLAGNCLSSSHQYERSKRANRLRYNLLLLVNGDRMVKCTKSF